MTYEPTHTPGPWYWTGSCPDGTMVTDDHGASIALWPENGASVEACANARLIAAAPMMEEALDSFLRVWDDSEPLPEVYRPIVLAVENHLRIALDAARREE